MPIKYAIINPLTGENVIALDAKEAVEKAVDMAIDFFYAHTHNNPFTIVETLEDGSEKWYSGVDGQAIPTPDELKAEASSRQKLSESFANAEKIAVTKL
jgi:hypothetical protein